MKHQQTNILYNTTMNNEFKAFHDKLHSSHHHYSEDAMNMSPLENSLLYAQDRGAPTSYFTPSTNPINWSERILQDIVGFLHILSPVGKVLYCSESCLELIGYHPQELIGKSLTEFLHPDDIDSFTTNLQQAFNAPTSVKLHYRIRGKNNSFLLVESIGQPKQILADRLHQAFIAIAQPYIPRSDGLLDSYLQMKMENEWLKKQLNNAMLTQTSSPASAADFSSTVDYHQQQQQHMNFQQQQQQPINHSNYYIPPPSSGNLHTNNNNYENTGDYSMPYYPSQSFTPFDRANNTNNDMMGTNPHYYMNNESPHISSRRQSNCSSIMYQTNNNTTTPTKDDTLNNQWCTPARYSPSVASSSEQNEKNSRFGQQEEMDLSSISAGLATTSSNDSSTTGHVKKEKWRRRKSRGADDYVCADCGTTASPEWRKGPQGPKTLCNACGLRWAKKNKKI